MSETKSLRIAGLFVNDVSGHRKTEDPLHILLPSDTWR